MTTPTRTRSRSGLAVAVLCFLTIVADGYDMVVYGAALPKILDEPGWNLSHGTAGLIGTWTLAGLMVGFLTAGPLTDRIGRRKVMLIGVTWISAGSMLSAVAMNVEMFGVARFLTGIGIGSVVPSAVALTMEYAPRRRRQLYNATMLTGFSFGGILAALSAMYLLPHHDWRVLFGLGAAFLILIPIMYFRLPESVGYLAARGRDDEGRALSAEYGLDYDTVVATVRAQTDSAAQAPGMRRLFERPLVSKLILFTVISICVNVVVYGLNTWAPALMREQGYALDSALTFMLLLQAGGVIGAIAGSYFADRVGCARVVTVLFLVGAVSLLVLSNKLDTIWVMIAILGAGIGGTGTNSVLYGFVATNFPTANRGSALGVVMGLGRIGAMLGPAMAGFILEAGLGAKMSFYAFAIPAIIGALLVTAVSLQGRRRSPADERTLVAA
ncbi:aromatic acid/H+ symport family MFS transporter [Gordonia sp. CPCC 205515]|uniref:MFS transporter n=1 Tax=Gordonia sp. CPCC 205515 TaxID=3140791 RepID=UPI003AF35C27